MFSEEDLKEILSKHPDVAGVSIAILFNDNIQAVAAGYARISTNEALTSSHYLQCASLSKTVATAFAIDYFTKKNISMATSVNQLLSDASSSWRIEVSMNSRSTPEKRSDMKYSIPYTGNDVTLAMLTNHTALGMHYVYGIPMSEPMPTALELLDGSCVGKGFDALYLLRQPGTSFAYSGGGFIVMQLLIETIEHDTIQNITRSYLDSVGLEQFTFEHEDIPGVSYAYGHINRNKEVQPHDGGRLKFAPFAAGAVCTPAALLTFLANLGAAYQRPGCTIGGISHHVASQMLSDDSLVDLGAIEFMRGKVGLGVFVAKAGPNKIMFHQAANDGFRGVYMVCFDGPDKGKGFIILSNGDNPAVYLQCELARALLAHNHGKGLNIRGVNFERLAAAAFDMKGLKQETIVNLGLRDLVLAAFDDPEAERVLGRSKHNSKL